MQAAVNYNENAQNDTENRINRQYLKFQLHEMFKKLEKILSVLNREKIETQTEFLQMKTIIFEMKNTLGGTINTLDIEEKTSKSEDIMIETMYIETKKKNIQNIIFLVLVFQF